MPVNSGQNVDLLYERPAATDADLVFGADYVPPRNDVVVQATLPLPVASVAFIPPARLEMQAELPGLTVSTLILRPSVETPSLRRFPSMCPFKPTLFALSTVALCACTTLPPPVSCPSPPEMLMRPPQALRSLPSPEPLPPTTRPVTKTPSN